MHEAEGGWFKDLMENQGGPSAEIKGQRVTRQAAQNSIGTVLDCWSVARSMPSTEIREDRDGAKSALFGGNSIWSNPTLADVQRTDGRMD